LVTVYLQLAVCTILSFFLQLTGLPGRRLPHS
jgi:hypothetical protein